jgi:putative flippase GtrA
MDRRLPRRPGLRAGARHARLPARPRTPIRIPLRAIAGTRGDWLQFGAFCAVGAAGAALNLAVYAGQVRLADIAPLVAAFVAFWVAVTHNYLVNRWVTFRRARGGVVAQGWRFAVVSLVALAVNLGLLALLLGVMASVAAQAVAICLATPVNFLGNKLWSFAGAAS